MELRHLRYFLTVAKTLNFTKAAEELHISQPPLSRQIRELEEEMNVTLFDRQNRRVQLSSAGEVFAERATRILTNLDSAVVETQRAARGEIGRIAVGFFEHIAYTLLPPLLGEFQLQYPAVTVELRWFSSAEQISALRRGDVDLVFVRSDPEDEELQSVLLLSEPFYIAIAKDHPLARKDKISITECSHLRVINYRKDVAPDYHLLINQLCASAGFSPSTEFEMGQIYASLGLVSSGFGITLVPASVQRTNMTNVAFRPLSEQFATSALYLVWHSASQNTVLSKFVQLAGDIASRP